MALLPDAPHIRLLLAMATAMRLVNYADLAGITDTVTVRHARNRNPVRGERPALTLFMVSDEPREAEQDLTMGETTRVMAVEVQGDMDLPSENSDLDPTGLGRLSRFVAAGVSALKHPTDEIYLSGLCDWISYGSVEPDDKSTSDEGRLVRAVSVIYRVRSDNPNVLLAQGENL